jgi:hypothetical protein
MRTLVVILCWRSPQAPRKRQACTRLGRATVDRAGDWPDTTPVVELPQATDGGEQTKNRCTANRSHDDDLVSIDRAKNPSSGIGVAQTAWTSSSSPQAWAVIRLAGSPHRRAGELGQRAEPRRPRPTHRPRRRGARTSGCERHPRQRGGRLAVLIDSLLYTGLVKALDVAWQLSLISLEALAVNHALNMRSSCWAVARDRSACTAASARAMPTPVRSRKIRRRPRASGAGV